MPVLKKNVKSHHACDVCVYVFVSMLLLLLLLLFFLYV
jgi:hypothetical protein